MFYFLNTFLTLVQSPNGFMILFVTFQSSRIPFNPLGRGIIFSFISPTTLDQIFKINHTVPCNITPTQY